MESASIFRQFLKWHTVVVLKNLNQPPLVLSTDKPLTFSSTTKSLGGIVQSAENLAQCIVLKEILQGRTSYAVSAQKDNY